MSQADMPQKSGGKGSALFFILILGIVAALLADRYVARISRLQDDLSLAENALKERDMGDAEMYFERYLRKNPSGPERWQVWQQLLSIALDLRQDKNTAMEYLEIMLSEFGGDGPKRRAIQMRFAALSDELRAYEKALPVWEALASDPETPAEERAVVYRELSRGYMRRLEFTAATDVLVLCRDLKVSNNTKADCLYALAETRMLTDELANSSQALEELLALPDVSEDRRVLGIFMLADVLEQQERYPEALELFESIRESYPNAGVLEVRLGNLFEKNQKSGGKPDVVPAPGYRRGR